MPSGEKTVLGKPGTVLFMAERGTHDELMAKNGAYAHFVRNEG